MRITWTKMVENMWFYSLATPTGGWRTERVALFDCVISLVRKWEYIYYFDTIYRLIQSINIGTIKLGEKHVTISDHCVECRTSVFKMGQ